MLPSALAQVLYREHLWRVQRGVQLSLELTGGAVLGLHVIHHETVINGHAGSYVLGHVLVRIGLADGE